MGKFFRSMGQARVSVILRREESTGNAKQWALPGAEPLRHPGLPAGWCLARDTLGQRLIVITSLPVLSHVALESIRAAEHLGL